MCERGLTGVPCRCRQQDSNAVSSAIAKAIPLYNERKLDEMVTISKVSLHQDCLPPNFEGNAVSGGVLLMDQSGKIKVNNTFNARLSIAAEQLLPNMRSSLFPSGSGLGGMTGKLD